MYMKDLVLFELLAETDDVLCRYTAVIAAGLERRQEGVRRLRAGLDENSSDMEWIRGLIHELQDCLDDVRGLMHLLPIRPHILVGLTCFTTSSKPKLMLKLGQDRPQALRRRRMSSMRMGACSLGGYPRLRSGRRSRWSSVD